ASAAVPTRAARLPGEGARRHGRVHSFLIPRSPGRQKEFPISSLHRPSPPGRTLLGWATAVVVIAAAWLRKGEGRPRGERAALGVARVGHRGGSSAGETRRARPPRRRSWGRCGSGGGEASGNGPRTTPRGGAA